MAQTNPEVTDGIAPEYRSYADEVAAAIAWMPEVEHTRVVESDLPVGLLEVEVEVTNAEDLGWVAGEVARVYGDEIVEHTDSAHTVGLMVLRP
jgi:hypothetical protein